MDISCLDNHLPTGMHPQLTTSTLFFTQHQLPLLATATLPSLQCQNPAEDTATAFTVQRENMFYGLPNEFALRSRHKVGLPKNKAQNPVVENSVFPH